MRVGCRQSLNPTAIILSASTCNTLSHVSMAYYGTGSVNATFTVDANDEDNGEMLSVCPRTLNPIEDQTKDNEPRINLPLSPGVTSVHSDESTALAELVATKQSSKHKTKGKRSQPAASASQRKTKEKQSKSATPALQRKTKENRSNPATPGSQRKPKPDKPLPPCGENCHQKCTTNFDEEERIRLFESFWKMSDGLKDQFYARYMQRPLASNKTTKKGQPLKGRKTKTDRRRVRYFLPKENSTITHSVCAKFFSGTLGYATNCINAGRRAMRSVKLGVVTERKRGKYARDTSKHDSIVRDIKGRIFVQANFSGFMNAVFFQITKNSRLSCSLSKNKFIHF